MTDRELPRTTRFRRLLIQPQLAFVMEAHDGMSARIAQEAGFEAIWASGLSISASMGVRDANEASWTQVLEHVEFMTDATTVPIMVDADTGYGNFNNVRRLVRKLEERGAAAMCIEDKLYPKTNSYIRGEEQPLMDVGEFCGKLRAAKDTQRDPDFTVVARCEALITGMGMGEALYRAEAYREAGADAVLVHSKQATADEIVEFMGAWSGACPIVIVPTTYYRTAPEVFERAGIAAVIWGNQLLRASVAAMQQMAGELARTRSLEGIEDRIATVKEIFRLTDATELDEAEARYLPAATRSRL
jgi:phosphoenolpyruvate phosphomutase